MMTDKRLKRPRDPVQLGKLMGDILTGQVEDRAPVPVLDPNKDQAAVALGRKGGLKGVESAEILSIIQQRWKPNYTSENVRPTLWRMVKKEGRLKKRGKIYCLPVESSQEEAGVLGTPARQ